MNPRRWRSGFCPPKLPQIDIRQKGQKGCPIKSIFTLTLLLLQTTLVVATDNPIKIILEGTHIHTLPYEVVMVSKNPKEKAKEFAKKANLDYSDFGIVRDHFNCFESAPGKPARRHCSFLAAAVA